MEPERGAKDWRGRRVVQRGRWVVVAVTSLAKRASYGARRQAPSGSSALLPYSIAWPACVGLLDGPKTEDLLSCYMGHN
jgi:hypothetical protein